MSRKSLCIALAICLTGCGDGSSNNPTLSPKSDRVVPGKPLLSVNNEAKIIDKVPDKEEIEEEKDRDENNLVDKIREQEERGEKNQTDQVNQESDSAEEKIPIPTSKPSFKTTTIKSDYYFSDSENSTSILDEDGKPIGQNLPPGTLIQISYTLETSYDAATDKYETEVLGYVHFESVPLLFGEKRYTGYMLLSDIDIANPVTDELQSKSFAKRYKIKMQAFQNKPEIKREDQNFDLQVALEQFHKTICAEDGYSKTSYIEKWQAFINAKPAELKGIATSAMYLDAVARTTIYEAHQDSHFKGQHPMMASCQWDIIALSIRNRAQKGYQMYGGRYRGDLFGVATNSQYNIWFNKYVRRYNYRITSCFLHPDIQNVRAKQGDRDFKSYQHHIGLYKRAVERFPEVLGLNDTVKPVSGNDYLKNLFAIDLEEERLPISQTNKLFTRKFDDYISNLTHYYHPGGMPRCSVHDYANSRGEKVINGVVKVKKEEGTEFYIIADNKLYVKDEENGDRLKAAAVKIERLERINMEDEQENGEKQDKQYWKFRIETSSGYVDSNEYFGGEAVLAEEELDSQIVERHRRYACLPNGHFSQCLKGQELADSGRRIPITWFDKFISRDFANSLINDFDMVGGVKYDISKSPGAGLPIAVQCIGKGMGSSPPQNDTGEPLYPEYPHFGGTCDKDIMLVTGVDGFR